MNLTLPKHKLLYLVIFLIFILLLIIWLGRIQLSELAISSAMKNFGLMNITADLSQLDINQSQAPLIGFSITTEDQEYSFDAQNIIIQYGLGQLTKGIIDSITIDKLEIHSIHTERSRQPTTESQHAFEPRKIIKELQYILRNKKFFNSLLIKNIKLDGDSFGTFHEKSLMVKGSNSDQELHIEVTLLEQNTVDKLTGTPQLIIAAHSGDKITAELRHTSTPDIKPAAVNFYINNTHISGDYHIKPQQVESCLQPLLTSDSINVSGVINGEFSINAENDNQISSVITLKSDKFSYNKNELDNFDAEFRINSSTNTPPRNIQLKNGSYMHANSISYDNLMLKDARINILGELTNNTRNWHYKGNFNSERITVHHDSREFQLKDAVVHTNANSENLYIDGNISSAAIRGMLGFELNHSFIDKSGQLSIKLAEPLDLGAENSKLSQLMNPWPYPFDLLSGKINISSHAVWSQHDAFNLNAIINIDNAGGHIGELVFSGLSLNHELEITPALHSLNTSNISLAIIDSGVTASNINTNLTVITSNLGSLPKIVINNLQGDIFGGKFASDGIIFDLNKSKNTLKITATNIDLAEIVETQQLKDITATGRIDGTIPIEINENGVLIENGAFVNNIRAGTIRYNPASGTEQLKQNPLTGIALDALKDFRYSELSAGVDFTPDGKLTIDLKLKGTSPELDTKRPVHLNINTEQNLISLLKSLRFAQGVSDSIDNKVRQQYEKSRNTN